MATAQVHFTNLHDDTQEKDKSSRDHNRVCKEMVHYKTPKKTDTEGPLSKLFLEQLLKIGELRLVRSAILSSDSCVDCMIHKICKLYREDFQQKQRNQDVPLACLIASLYKAGEMMNYNDVFFSYIENLQGNLDKYQLKNKNLIMFLIGFLLFTTAWNRNDFEKARQWLDYSTYALATVGSKAWLGDRFYMLARWEHGLALRGDTMNCAEHLANEYNYCNLSCQCYLEHRNCYNENVSYKLSIRFAKMIQLKLALPVHHKRFPIIREPAIQQLHHCSITVDDLKVAQAQQDQLKREATECQPMHKAEEEFYVQYGDMYLLIRQAQLLAKGDFFQEALRMSSISCSQPGLMEDWNNVATDHINQIAETVEEPIQAITKKAIEICDQLQQNKVYVEKNTYHDVLGWIKESIKPYLQNFNPHVFHAQNSEVSIWRYQEPNDEEPQDSMDSMDLN